MTLEDIEENTVRCYTSQEVSSMLKLESHYILRLIATGELKAWRTNGKTGPWRVSGQALIDFITKREAITRGA